MADPPDRGPEVPFVVLGYHVLGPQSGTLYGYRRLDEPPRAIDPLRGPHPGLGSGIRADLFASSDSPFPEAALYVLNGPPKGAMNGGTRDVESGSPFWDVACRHSRLYCLVEGGQLWAYDARTLGHPSTWSFPQVPGATSSTRIQVGDTLVYCTTETQGATTLFGFDPGTGQRRLQHSLPYRNCRVLIAGGEVLVLGEASTLTERVERYSLQSFGDTTTPAQPERVRELALSSRNPEEVPLPVQVGSDFVFVMPDGKIQRWGKDPLEDPQMLWPNPRGARIWPHPVPLGPREVGFVAEAELAGFQLVRIQADDEGRASLRGLPGLPMLQGSRARAVTAFGGVLYMCVQPAGNPIGLQALVLEQAGDGEARPREFAVLDGSQDAEVHEIQALPWDGELRLLLEYRPTAQALYQEFYLVHPTTGGRQKINWAPPKDTDARVLWESGRAWRVDLSKGRIQVEA